MNISQVPTASLAARRVWGEANVCLTHSPGTDGRKSSNSRQCLRTVEERTQGDARLDTCGCW